MRHKPIRVVKRPKSKKPEINLKRLIKRLKRTIRGLKHNGKS